MSQSNDDVWPTYKRLLSYVRPYWFMLLISVLGYALYAATQAGGAQLAGYLGDTIVNPTDFRVMVVAIAPLVLVIFQGLGQFMGSYSMNWVAQQLVYVLRNDVFGHVLKLPQSEYYRNASGRIMSKIIFDAQQVTIVNPPPGEIGNPVWLIGTMHADAFTVIPEPSTMVLVGLGILSLLILRRRHTI